MITRSISLGCLACAIGLVQTIAPPAAVARQTPVAGSVRVLASQILPSGAAGRDSRVGGLSGLAYDRVRAEWLAVSDDRHAPRWFSLRLESTSGRHRVLVGRPTYAALPPTGSAPGQLLDFEAVVLLPDGDLLIASEGDVTDGRRHPSRLLRYRRDGGYAGEISLPTKFLPASSSVTARQGLRDNRGFEGLASTEDGCRLWAVAEAPLLQDDEPASFARGAHTRLLELRRVDSTFLPVRELGYRLDRVDVPRGFSRDAQVNVGISDLTLLPDGTLVSMERAFIRDPRTRRSTNIIRLFSLQLEGADDVSEVASLRGRTDVRMVRKRLLVDLGSVTSALLPRLAALDNVEAVAPGPSLLNSRSLLVMSDDNFNATQVTAAILLRY